MKEFFVEYVRIISKSIIGLLFGLGFFYILLNAFHASSINKVVYVSELDVYYSSYLDNVLAIKKNLDNYRYDKDKFAHNMPTMQKISSEITACYNILNSNEGLLGKSEGMKLGFNDVYNLNNYFINSLIDQCFISDISWVMKDEVLQDSNFAREVAIQYNVNDILSNNSMYIKDELRDNSSYYYNTAVSNAMIRNDLNSSYRLVLRNYYDFSKIILNLSEYLVRGDK